MKIKQVEELVGITRKNIRFYEEQGLLNVERAENGYREYHTADIARLQEIKLFRKMDISIEEMRALFEKRKSLQFCLEQHLGELECRNFAEHIRRLAVTFRQQYVLKPLLVKNLKKLTSLYYLTVRRRFYKRDYRAVSFLRIV